MYRWFYNFLALNTAQGVSPLTSTMIPKFLLAKSCTPGPNIFNIMKDHVLAAPEIVSKILCYKLSGSYKNGAAIIWISQKDFLIRRVDIDQTIKNIEFHTEYFLFENLLSGTEKILLNQSCLKGLPSMGVFNMERIIS